MFLAERTAAPGKTHGKSELGLRTDKEIEGSPMCSTYGILPRGWGDWRSDRWRIVVDDGLVMLWRRRRRRNDLKRIRRLRDQWMERTCVVVNGWGWLRARVMRIQGRKRKDRVRVICVGVGVS